MDERNKLEERVKKLAVKADQLDEFKEKCRQLERDITEKDSIIFKYQTRESDTQKELSSIREYLDGKNRECEGYIGKLKATDSAGPGLSPSTVEISECPTKFFDLFKKRFTLEEMASDAQVRHKKIQRTLVQFLLPSDVIE
jgi:chromosome segregation ATPase